MRISKFSAFVPRGEGMLHTSIDHLLLFTTTTVAQDDEDDEKEVGVGVIEKPKPALEDALRNRSSGPSWWSWWRQWCAHWWSGYGVSEDGSRLGQRRQENNNHNNS